MGLRHNELDEEGGERGKRDPGEGGDEVPFPSLSRSDSVPSSGCPMHVLAVGRVPCTWRFGMHGVGTRKYSSKGAVFAPILNKSLSPRVSSLRSHPAVGLDMVNLGCITAAERIL